MAALGDKQAVIVGHDWGAPVAWHAALFRPDVFTAVAGLSVPPPFRGRGRPLQTLRDSGITNFYWQYFQESGIAEREFERDVGLTMRTLLGRGFSDPAASLFVEHGQGFLEGFLGDAGTVTPLPDWLSESDLAYFTKAYRESGFRGGMNWYRNIDRNWELTAPWQGARIFQPSLFIAGSNDSVITGLIGNKRVADMERVLPGLRQKLIIDGAGHWVQQERPDEVNAALIGFSQRERPGLVEPAAGQHFARPVRIDRRIGRNRPHVRRIIAVTVIRHRARIVGNPHAGAGTGRGRHLRGGIDRGLVRRGIAEAIGPAFRHRHLAADGATARRRHFRNEGTGGRHPDQRRRRRRHAGAQGRHQLDVVGAFQRRPADIFDPYVRDAVALELKQFGGPAGHVHHPVAVIRPAVVDADDQRFAVAEIGDARITRHRQRRMGGGQRGHVEHFAIGGQPAVEIVAIPGGQAFLAIIDIFFGDIDPAADGIGFADAVGAAALGHRIAPPRPPADWRKRHIGDRRGRQTCPTRRSWPETGMPHGKRAARRPDQRI